MFDFRYHAISLAAVFLALGLGILLGVTIGDSLVSSADRGLRSSLREDVVDARAQEEEARTGLDQREDVIRRLAPRALEGTLDGRRIAVVTVGPLPDGLESAIRRSIDRAGGRVAPMTVLPTPKRPTQPDLGEQYGRVDGIVFHGLPPGSTEGEAAANFAEAVLETLVDTGTPVVGVEASGPSEQSQVPSYADAGIASVDNLDSAAGQIALAFALRDGGDGRFGFKDSADETLPPVPRGVRSGG